MNYPTDSKEIADFLCRQWAQEFPGQNPRFPSYYQWEFRCLPVTFFVKSHPEDKEKAERYLNALCNGADFPPVVYLELFGEVINGIHRLWAYQQLGVLDVPTYIGKVCLQ